MKMHCVVLLVFSVFCAVANAAPVSRERTLKVPQQYQTISAAIAAAKNGDLVKVANGTYREQVIIDKAIRLEGTDPERTIIDGDGMNNLKGLGQVRIVAEGNVEFSKFKIINAGRPSDQYNVAIYSQSPVAGVTYDIHHTRVRQALNTNPDPEFEDSGYGVHSTLGLEHLDLHHSDVAETDRCAVYIVGHTGPLTIRDNSIALGFGRGDPCVIASGSDDIATPQRLLRNTIDMGTENLTPGYYGTGIMINAAEGDFKDVQLVGNVVKNIIHNRRGINFVGVGGTLRGSIANNQILGDGGYIGITIWGKCEDVTVQNNLITGISENSSTIVDGVEVESPGTNGGIRVRPLFFSPVGTRIEDNYIEALRGISVEGVASLSVIRRNHVWAAGEIAVQLGGFTSFNRVINNWLRSTLGEGDATVADDGTDNIVQGNH